MLAAGCASSRQAAENSLAVAPSPYSVMPAADGTVFLDMQISMPEHYVPRRSRIVILPRIMKDTVILAELKPVAVDAPIYQKKMERVEVLEGYQDEYEGYRRGLDKVSDTLLVMYRDTANLGQMADGSRIKAFVTSDGCGSCKALDTLDWGGISDPSVFLDLDAWKLKALEPKFIVRPKFREGKGEALLQFRINRSEIDYKIGRNSQELGDMLLALQRVVSDSLATLTSVSIYGMASADGSLAFNTRLAKDRAASARNWLVSQLDGLTRDQRRCFSVGSRPEGWMPVLAAMTAAGDKDSVMVKEILEKYADSNDDVQERYIRRLPCWNSIKTKYLQKDRKVEYVYTYTIKSFTTDEEMLELYGTRPDAFNEEEFLRVSSLKSDPEEKMEVYRTTLKYFPQSQVAANNLAIMLLGTDGLTEADEILSVLQTYLPETQNTHAVVKAERTSTELAKELLAACDTLPEARYNLGLLKAAVKDFAGAYELLRPFGDLNAAVTAVCLGKFVEADAILDALQDMSPETEYVRAMVAAALMDADAFFTHLEPAVADEALRQRAENDSYFDVYRHDDRFKVIMEGR